MKRLLYTSIGLLTLAIAACSPSKQENTKTLESISAKDYTTTYYVDDVFAFDGVLTATYSDKSSKEVTPTNVSSPDMSIEGSKEITIAYTESSITKFTSYTITVSAKQDDQGGSDDETDSTKFNKTVQKILTDHNYTVNVKGRFQDEEDDFCNYNLININNDAIYTDESNYFNQGYIRQKDQGIVEFFQNKESGVIVPSDFICTNDKLGMDELYVLAVENILNVNFTFDSTTNAFVGAGRNQIAVIGNLGLGDYIIWASAPEKNRFTVTSSDNYATLIVKTQFIYNYQEAVAGSLDDTFKQIPFDVEITIKEIGTSTNKNIEEYVANPSYVYPNPTDWSEGDEESIKEHFGGEVAPFIEGLTYSYKIGETLVEGKYYACVEDYASGDLTDDYKAILESNGFEDNGEGVYIKSALNEQKTRKLVWKVLFNYYSSTDKDETGMAYGYLYPQGVFTVLFRYEETFEGVINTIEDLNNYIQNSTKAGGYLPELPTDIEINKITGFNDTTASAGSNFAFVAPTQGGYFKIYIDKYEDAVAFIQEYGKALEGRGFETQGMGHFVFCSWTDDYGSKVYFGDITFAGKEAYAKYPYIQMNFTIYQDSIDHYVPYEEVTLTKIEVSKQTTTYSVNSTFTFDGEVTAIYSDGSSKVVTPTSISSPDMTVAGEKTVTVSYTENDVTVSTNYLIDVVEGQVNYYSVTLNGGSGATINVSKPSNLNSIVEGTMVTFTVKLNENYKLDSVVVSDSKGSEITLNGPNLMTGAYQFTMPSDNVTITVNTSLIDTFIGSYHLKVMINDKAYNDYIFTFNADGTGSYRRNQINSSGENVGTYNIYFTYKRNNDKVTITYTKMDTNTSNTSYQAYRLFEAIDTSSSEPIINNTGVINSDGSFSIDLFDSSGKTTQYTFTKLQ